MIAAIPARRKAATAVPLPYEVRTHVAVADALRVGCVPGWMWSHFPAGEKRSEKTGERLKRMGLKRGWSDFLLIDPDGVHHWLELKRGKEALSDPQEAFRDACRDRGVPWALARSFEEAVTVLTEWGALRLRVSA